MNVSSALAVANGTISNTSFDIIVIVFFLAAGFLLGTSGGKTKMLSFLFATYLALLLSPTVFGYLDLYGFGKHLYRNLAAYIIVLLLIGIFFDSIIFRKMPRASSRWWQALVMSFLIVGFFVAGTLNLAVLRGIITLSPVTLSLFAGKSAYVFWSIAPLVGLWILARFR